MFSQDETSKNFRFRKLIALVVTHFDQITKTIKLSCQHNVS